MTDQQQDQPQEEQIGPIIAERGGRYPIRLIHLINGTLIMGFVIQTLPDVLLVLRPYEVITTETEEGNILAYELEPYLDQLAEYDANSLLPVPFMTANMVAVVLPAQHLIKTFMSIIRLRENFETLDEYPIRKRHYPSAETKH